MWRKETIERATTFGPESVEALTLDHAAVVKLGGGWSVIERGTGLRVYSVQFKRDAVRLAEALAPFYEGEERVGSLADMRPVIEQYRTGRYVEPVVERTEKTRSQRSIVTDATTEDLTQTRAPVSLEAVRRWLTRNSRPEKMNLYRLSRASLHLDVVIRLEPAQEFLSVVGALEGIGWAYEMTRDQVIEAIKAEAV
jgi:hypothetical protein